MLRTSLNILLATALAATLLVGSAWAADFKDLSAQELKAMLDGGQPVLVVNPLSDIEFNENHIPGSVNIPLHLVATTDQLPQDKATPIVLYCLGPK